MLYIKKAPRSELRSYYSPKSIFAQINSENGIQVLEIVCDKTDAHENFDGKAGSTALFLFMFMKMQREMQISLEKFSWDAV